MILTRVLSKGLQPRFGLQNNDFICFQKEHVTMIKFAPAAFDRV
jgi:hypothetical protein